MDNEAKEEKGDQDALFRQLKGWFQADWDKQSDWRKDAREDYDFDAGHQLSE